MNNNQVSDSIGRAVASISMTLTFLVLLVLKLTGLTDMSWWLVTLPLWAGVALFLVMLVVIFLVGFIIRIINYAKGK